MTKNPTLSPFVNRYADCHASHAEDDSPQLVCNVCNHAWCKSCKVDWHTGLSCDEHLRQVLPQYSSNHHRLLLPQ